MRVPVSQKGFTIVELLIVIVIIGILAAITIVSYNGIQNRANDAAVMSDLSNVSQQIVLYNAEHGSFPEGSTQLAELKMKLSTDAYSRGMNNGTSWFNVVYCWPNMANPSVFAIVAQSKSGTVFEAKGQGVRQAPYALAGSAATCTDAGVTMDSGSNRDWFYESDTWHSYVR